MRARASSTAAARGVGRDLGLVRLAASPRRRRPARWSGRPARPRRPRAGPPGRPAGRRCGRRASASWPVSCPTSAARALTAARLRASAASPGSVGGGGAAAAVVVPRPAARRPRARRAAPYVPTVAPDLPPDHEADRQLIDAGSCQLRGVNGVATTGAAPTSTRTDDRFPRKGRCRPERRSDHRAGAVSVRVRSRRTVSAAPAPRQAPHLRRRATTGDRRDRAREDRRSRQRSPACRRRPCSGCLWVRYVLLGPSTAIPAPASSSPPGPSATCSSGSRASAGRTPR